MDKIDRKTDREYDYGIIGIGAAGSHLLLTMLDDPFFTDKSILVIDKSDKTENDRTWSFWELSKGKWDDIIQHKWEKGHFITSAADIALELSPYTYKTIRSSDFYQLVKRRINAASNVDTLTQPVKSVGNIDGKPVILLENGTQIMVGHLFDSRINKRFFQENDTYFRVWQHFKGSVVRTKKSVFDPKAFVMMDFRVKYRNDTSFIYILPFSEHRALVEFTFFSPQIQEEQVYDEAIRKYLEKVMGVEEYAIEETETGVIPMTNYPFHASSSDKHLRIGTAGSWVKPSSGYSFKNSERKALQVVSNLKAGRSTDAHLISSRHRFYDSIFLDLLYQRNHLGEELFHSMYSKNDVRSIFRFLDEETTWREEYAIIQSFAPKPFIAALGRNIARRFFHLK